MRAEGVDTTRNILCVFPRYTSAFATWEYAYPLTDGVQALMPPQATSTRGGTAVDRRPS